MFCSHLRSMSLLLLSVLLLLLLLHPVVGQTSSSGAFVPTVPATAGPTAAAGSASELVSNATMCPARYHDCSVIAHPEACCALDQVCVFDDSGTTACCPFRTVCVGKLDVSGVARNTPPPTLGGLMSPSLAVGVAVLAAGVWLRGHLAMA